MSVLHLRKVGDGCNNDKCLKHHALKVRQKHDPSIALNLDMPMARGKFPQDQKEIVTVPSLSLTQGVLESNHWRERNSSQAKRIRLGTSMVMPSSSATGGH